VEAPLEIPVMRKEIYEEIKSNNEQAAGSAKQRVKQLVNN
jgi:sRNA-binding carbon storage regulator CsrA